MIVGNEGGLGSGKTIMSVRHLYQDFVKGIPIYSNIWLDFPHKKLDLNTIRKILKSKDINFASVFIDEITVFMDCRRSMNELNLLISYFILQSRKRGVKFYFTTQDFDMVDRRLLNHTDIMLECYMITKPFLFKGEIIKPEWDDILKIKHCKDWREYTLIDLRDRRQIKTRNFKLKISLYYSLYDTNETILPIDI